MDTESNQLGQNGRWGFQIKLAFNRHKNTTVD